jgi:hypothetical protein
MYTTSPSPLMVHTIETIAEAKRNLERFEWQVLNRKANIRWMEDTGQSKSYICQRARVFLAEYEEAVKQVKKLWGI